MMEPFTAFLVTAMPIVILLLGGMGWLYRTEREKRREMEQRLNEKKAGIYESYITNITSIFHKDNEREIKSGSISNKRIFDIVKKMVEFHRFLLVYGSNETIRVQSKYMSFLHSEGKYEGVFHDEELAALKNHFYYLANTINAMRSELGHRAKPITMDELARLFITDYVPGNFGEKR